MPKLIFTQDEIDNYLKEKTFHNYYKKTIEIEEQMAVHADGIYPKKLLDERRPNEPLEVKEYRKIIWSAKTKPTFYKIFSSLQKIRRSQDWSIRYENQDQFSKIREQETLEDYCETMYPGFYSVTNWVFTLMLRKYLIDPNAVVFVAPITREIPENEYLKPIAQIFDSKNVIDYVHEDYAVLLNPTGAVYISGNKPVRGKTYWIITTEQTFRYDQINGRMQFALVDRYDHNLGYLPAFKLKGIIVDQTENMHLYESKINGVIPEFDEAVREYSDLQAAKVLHIYPERWEFAQNECTACKGQGLARNPAWYEGCAAEVMAQIQCTTCQGRGFTVAGPYSKIMVHPVKNAAIEGIAQIPTPPAGYVEKDVDIVEIMDQSVEKHIYNALAAINFEFLQKTPLSESGIAKEVDKDELNNSVHSIAEDIVAAMDSIYWLIALYRYKELYAPEDIVEMIPDVHVPEKFDILSSQHSLDELTSAKTAKINPVLQGAMEELFANARFNTDPSVRDKLVLILKLDPLPNITEDDKMSRLSNKGITLETYVISSNIQEFVQRAIEEDQKFVDLELEKQREVLKKYAKEIIDANEAVKLEMADTGVDEEGNIIPTNGVNA